VPNSTDGVRFGPKAPGSHESDMAGSHGWDRFQLSRAHLSLLGAKIRFRHDQMPTDADSTEPCCFNAMV